MCVCVCVCLITRLLWTKCPNCWEKGYEQSERRKRKSWCPHTNGDETRRDVISTRMYECANGEGLSLFPGLFFCDIIQAFDLFFCLLRPVSHNTLSSSDAFIMWYFVSCCSLPRRGFHFYAVTKRQDLCGVHKHVHVHNLFSTGKHWENRFLWQHQSNTDLAINLDVTVITKSLHELMI